MDYIKLFSLNNETFNKGENRTDNNFENLFEIAFLTPSRERIIISSDDYKFVSISGGKIIFEDSKVFNGVVTVTINSVLGEEKNLRISVKNNTENIIESILFPTIAFDCNMVKNGGEDKLFWPSMEGTIILDSSNEFFSFPENTLGGSYCGVTPGAAVMQYMAFFSPENNVYYGAHDSECNLKDFEYRFINDNKVEFYCKLYPNGAKEYDMNYDIVIKKFSGDWQDAAEIYRDWLENSDLPLPEKLINRDDLPSWLDDSPVTMIYPIRGTKDTDRDEKMVPNCYYPYTNILPIVDYYAEKFDSKIMPLLTHWEGSSPWATPYIWPPYGDEDNFHQMVKSIHEKGHLVGLYASGLGITTQGVTDSSYVNFDEFENGGWKEVLCEDYKGEAIFTDLAFVRSGYDVCPKSEKVKDVMVAEALKIANAHIDYFQAFDQNLGGLPKFCWSHDHGHPKAPGKWISDEMSDLFERMQNKIYDSNKNMIFGCESAASETSMKHLPFNDARWFTAFRQGVPVPAYSYIYHEYCGNYMGNQNGIEKIFDLEKSPENLLYRTAYSFLAGDMLTIILGDKGKIGWSWNALYDGSYPEQEIIAEFIKDANKWRKGFTKKYLRYGKMLKCKEVDIAKSPAIILNNGDEILVPNIMNSKFVADDNTVAEFFVNRTFSKQVLKLDGYNKDAKLYLSPEEETQFESEITLEAGQIICVISK